MKMLIANYDRKLYFRPVTLGPVKGGGLGVVPAGEGHDVSWARLLLALLAGDAEPPLDTWAGDRVAVLRPGDESTSLLTKTDVALYVLAHTKPCNYQFVLDHYADVTGLLLQDDDLEFASDFDWFLRTSLRCGLKTLTRHGARLLLAEAARECGSCYDDFLEWLNSQRGLGHGAGDLVRAELDPQRRRRRARGPRSGSRRC